MAVGLITRYHGQEDLIQTNSLLTYPKRKPRPSALRLREALPRIHSYPCKTFSDPSLSLKPHRYYLGGSASNRTTMSFRGLTSEKLKIYKTGRNFCQPDWYI